MATNKKKAKEGQYFKALSLVYLDEEIVVYLFCFLLCSSNII